MNYKKKLIKGSKTFKGMTKYQIYYVKWFLLFPYRVYLPGTYDTKDEAMRIALGLSDLDNKSYRISKFTV